MAPQDAGVPLGGIADLQNRPGHRDIFNAEFQGVSKGRTADHGVAIYTEVTDPLTRTRKQSNIGSRRKPLSVSIDRETLPV